ncbi:class I SAM-dependent methyltransferase [Anaeroselena agilis]|uniref:Class I SAM-dependent methyltransferase n=1 Tax=Anaeroselena agilis TaxID=3063788 RepID=A0ABU3NSE6_9FIRM|nr:class I SAM-dependent methyltransferase [Selenomonadales bacterium 4137-cl]
MRLSAVDVYRCPETGQALRLAAGAVISRGDITEGVLVSAGGKEYRVKDGVPDFTFPATLMENDGFSRREYDAAAEEYNSLQHVTFDILCHDEKKFREEMIGLMRIKEGDRVLETAAGTGLNLPYIFTELKNSGEVYVQDISPGMLSVCGAVAGQRDDVGCERSVGNAAYLPFPDNYFDSALSFGGIGVFAEQEKAIREMVRVVKPGGRIVFGDEGVGPWLKSSTYGKILIDNNRYYDDEAPIRLLPVEARDVAVRWVLGGGFYLMDFSVGEGEPEANFAYPIPGKRGGTLLTRYYGKLEGVSPATKELAQKARDKSGKSMHQWLEEAIRLAAERDLKA